VEQIRSSAAGENVWHDAKTRFVGLHSSIVAEMGRCIAGELVVLEHYIVAAVELGHHSWPVGLERCIVVELELHN